MISKNISHYKIIEKLGAGGMGVVYKAQDLKLDRFVALKFLSPNLSADEEEKKRFIQEAKAASALDHVNICTIYEIDETADGADGVRRMFIAMAYYEGETLKKKVVSGQLSVDSVIDIAIQMAQGLAKAHAHGIFHRDIKPANVIVTTESVVKILDFGLAKLAGQSRLTKSGATLGTVAYMSPEQARGEELDSRSDIWSLGAVLYEMLTGQLPFKGDHEQVMLYSIIHEKPQPIRGLRSDLPLELENIVFKCLAKKSADRYQQVDELLTDLKRERKSTAPAKAIRRMPWSKSKRAGIRRIVWFMAFLALATMVFFLLKVFKPFSKRYSPPLVAVPLTSYPGLEDCPAFSPDGKQIAFSWYRYRPGEERDIYVQLIGAGEPLRLTNHPGAEFSPAWSPDGRYIAFVRDFEDKFSIHLVPALGGVERQLQSVNWSIYRNFHNISWSPDGKFLAIPHRESTQEPVSLYLLSLEGLEKHKLATPPALYQGDLYSAFSPDGKKLAFIRHQSLSVNSIHIVPVNGGESQLLYDEKNDISGLTWTSDGREIVFKGSHLGSDGFWRISAAGGMPERVPLEGGGDSFGNPTISRQGQRLAYEQTKTDENIWRIDLSTAKKQSATPYSLISSSRQDWFPNISPDGSKIVFTSSRTGSGQIWMCDSNGHNAVQLTSFTTGAGSPRWSPDGEHIAFDSRLQNHTDIFMLNVNGGNPQRVTTEASDDITPSWSRDGRWIYYASNRSGSFEIWRSPVQGGDAVQITTGADGISPYESFDGKLVYYAKQRTPGVWRTPTQGGEESLVLEFPPTRLWMKWALSKDGIYYLHQGTLGHTIEFFSFVTRKVTRITELGSKGPLFTLAVSPDQRWLLYSHREEDIDIMVVENFR